MDCFLNAYVKDKRWMINLYVIQSPITLPGLWIALCSSPVSSCVVGCGHFGESLGIPVPKVASNA
jgi:hypothetical protein